MELFRSVNVSISADKTDKTGFNKQYSIALNKVYNMPFSHVNLFTGKKVLPLPVTSESIRFRLEKAASCFIALGLSSDNK